MTASDSFCAATKGGDVCDADNRYHALEWQLYGSTQGCAFVQAFPLLSRMQVRPGGGPCARARAWEGMCVATGLPYARTRLLPAACGWHVLLIFPSMPMPPARADV